MEYHSDLDAYTAACFWANLTGGVMLGIIGLDLIQCGWSVNVEGNVLTFWGPKPR